MINRLLIVRHAIAEDRQEAFNSGKSDEKRNLTTVGIRKMIHASRGLARICPEIEAIVTSPYNRAAQTADILSKYLEPREVIECDQLMPGGDFGELMSWLHTLPYKSIAIVGHEPDLSMFASWLIYSDEYSPFLLKKGGAIMVEGYGEIKKSESVLRWFLAPKQLRMLDCEGM